MSESTPPKRKRGRPRKSEIEANKRGNRGVRGRPKGDAAIINEYKARMLTSPKSEHVLQTLLDVASDPEHKHWTAATKMVVDRLLPATYFEKEGKGGSGKVEVNLNFSEPPKVEIVEEAVDVEFTEVVDDDLPSD